jgi:hypothetical protein
MVPRDTPVKLVCGLVAPDEARPRASTSIAAGTLPRRGVDYFHPVTVAGHRGENWSENSPGTFATERKREAGVIIFPPRTCPKGHQQLLKNSRVAAFQAIRDPGARGFKLRSCSYLSARNCVAPQVDRRAAFFNRLAHSRNNAPHFFASQRLTPVPDNAALPGLSDPRFPKTRPNAARRCPFRPPPASPRHPTNSGG